MDKKPSHQQSVLDFSQIQYLYASDSNDANHSTSYLQKPIQIYVRLKQLLKIVQVINWAVNLRVQTDYEYSLLVDKLYL